MGVVCGYYIVNDQIINRFVVHHENAQEFFDINFTNVTGKYHLPYETVFELDKGWDIAHYLLKRCDQTAENVLQFLDGQSFSNKTGSDKCSYIKSETVRKIDLALQSISLKDVMQVHQTIQQLPDDIYGAAFFDQLEYILNHVDIIKRAFKKAHENNRGIVINFH